VATTLRLAVVLLLAACGTTGTGRPVTASGLTRLGQREYASHHPQLAAMSYRAALARDGSYVPALIGLAEIAIPFVPVEAAALLDEVVAVAPTDAAAHRLFGQVLISMGEAQAGRAQLGIAARLVAKAST